MVVGSWCHQDGGAVGSVVGRWSAAGGRNGSLPASSTHSTSLPSAFVISGERRSRLVECSPGLVCSGLNTGMVGHPPSFRGHPVWVCCCFPVPLSL